jgi:hypothetical protein
VDHKLELQVFHTFMTIREDLKCNACGSSSGRGSIDFYDNGNLLICRGWAQLKSVSYVVHWYFIKPGREPENDETLLCRYNLARLTRILSLNPATHIPLGEWRKAGRTANADVAAGAVMSCAADRLRAQPNPQRSLRTNRANIHQNID